MASANEDDEQAPMMIAAMDQSKVRIKKKKRGAGETAVKCELHHTIDADK